MEALSRCSGLVAVLHGRGKIPLGNDKYGETSSIWINQEVAILSYRRWLENAPIPVKIFKEPEVAIEGAMTSQIANPTNFASNNQVLQEVGNWLRDASFSPPLDQAEFRRLADQLDDGDWMVIEAVFAGGGTDVSHGHVSQYLQKSKHLGDTTATPIVNSAFLKFASTGNNLLLHHRHGPGNETLTLNESWQWELRRELGRRVAGLAAQPS
jgi:hypothetical protein